jgi:hypothetical protein
MMDDNKLAEYLDQGRWLLNNGMANDQVKNQLFMFGSIVHKDVQALEVDIVPENKLVKYNIYLKSDIIDKANKYKELSTQTSLIGMWKFKRFLKKEGNLNFTGILNKFIKGSVQVEVSDFDKYFDGASSGEDGSSWNFNQLPDK